MNTLPVQLEELAWELVYDCKEFKEFLLLVSAHDESADFFETELHDVWNEFWSKEQEGCPDCDHH